MTTILITGVAGFIGSNVAKSLLEQGNTVIGVDNFSDYYDVSLKEARVSQLIGNQENFILYRQDISDFDAMLEIFKKHKIDKVCHLAAQAGVRYSIENPFIYEKTNSLGTLVMLECCKQTGVKNFIYASSSSVYGNNKKVPFSVDDRVDTPISLYAATKKSNELYAHVYHHLFKINCTGLRFFTVYGPWGRPDMALFSFTKDIIAGKPIKVFNEGKMKRDFTFVDDIVQGVLAALEKCYPYEVFNIGNSDTVELMRYIEVLEKAIGKDAEKEMLPMQPGDVPETFADIEKSTELLGYKPTTSVEEGIPKFVEWYKKFYNV